MIGVLRKKKMSLRLNCSIKIQSAKKLQMVSVGGTGTTWYGAATDCAKNWATKKAPESVPVGLG